MNCSKILPITWWSAITHVKSLKQSKNVQENFRRNRKEGRKNAEKFSSNHNRRTMEQIVSQQIKLASSAWFVLISALTPSLAEWSLAPSYGSLKKLQRLFFCEKICLQRVYVYCLNINVLYRDISWYLYFGTPLFCVKHIYYWPCVCVCVCSGEDCVETSHLNSHSWVSMLSSSPSPPSSNASSSSSFFSGGFS